MTAADAAAEPSPEAIFARARAAWYAQAYPRRLRYVVAVRVRQGDVVRTRHYTAAYAPDEGRLVVRRFSEEETAHPYVPRGVDLRLTFTITMGGSESLTTPSLHPPPLATEDELGVPFLEPTYGLGLGARPARPAPLPTAGSGTPALRVIGSTATRTAVYAVTLLGRETIAEHETYHLGLRALRDPQRNRLRDLWVDTDSYATRRARVAGNFVDEPMASTPWTIAFRTVGDAQYIDSEHADVPLHFKGRRPYDEASISFERLTLESGPDPTDLQLGMPPIESGLREPPR